MNFYILLVHEQKSLFLGVYLTKCLHILLPKGMYKDVHHNAIQINQKTLKLPPKHRMGK